jgi:hypothetical protein
MIIFFLELCFDFEINENFRRNDSMKALKRDLQYIVKGLNALRRQTEKLVKELDKLEKAYK